MSFRCTAVPWPLNSTDSPLFSGFLFAFCSFFRAMFASDQRSAAYYRMASANKYMQHTQTHVIDGVEIRALSALRGHFLDLSRTFLFASSATVPACLDLSRGEPARWPTRGLRKRRLMRNRLNVGAFMPASEYETLTRRLCGQKLRLYIR